MEAAPAVDAVSARRGTISLLSRLGVLVFMSVMAPGAAFADAAVSTCTGWQVTRVIGSATNLSGGRQGVPVKINDCIEIGMSIKTGDSSTVQLRRGANTISIPAASVAVLDTQAMIFQVAWMKSSLAASLQRARRTERLSVQTPVAVTGVRGTEKGESPQPGNFQWFDESTDEMSTIDELEITYRKMEAILARTTNSEARARLHLYLADLAMLLLRPTEARSHLDSIPPASKSYSAAQQRTIR